MSKGINKELLDRLIEERKRFVLQKSDMYLLSEQQMADFKSEWKWAANDNHHFVSINGREPTKKLDHSIAIADGTQSHTAAPIGFEVVFNDAFAISDGTFKASYMDVPVKILSATCKDGVYTVTIDSNSVKAAQDHVNSLDVDIAYPETFNPIV